MNGNAMLDELLQGAYSAGNRRRCRCKSFTNVFAVSYYRHTDSNPVAQIYKQIDVSGDQWGFLLHQDEVRPRSGS